MAHGEITMNITAPSQDLYRIVQQEVDLGAHALRHENADVAITFFQSALEKLTFQQPFYDHLVYNLLMGYTLLARQRLEAGDNTSAIYAPR
jgi:hypothetical protein